MSPEVAVQFSVLMRCVNKVIHMLDFSVGNNPSSSKWTCLAALKKLKEHSRCPNFHIGMPNTVTGVIGLEQDRTLVDILIRSI